MALQVLTCTGRPPKLGPPSSQVRPIDTRACAAASNERSTNWHAWRSKTALLCQGTEQRSEARSASDAAALSPRQRMKAVEQQSTKQQQRPGERLEETTYRQLRIVAGIQKDRCVAIAYRAGKKFLQSEGDDVSSAIANLKAGIDELQSKRETLRPDGVPTAEEYRDALLRIYQFVNPVQQSALFRHAGKPQAWASFAELAKQLDTDPELIQRAYAKIGRYLGNILNYEPDPGDLRKPLQPILVIAEPKEDDGELTWILRPNLVAALEAEPVKRSRGAA
jgi:hypothetical protein